VQEQPKSSLDKPTLELIHGECKCIDQARHLLRRCGLACNKDYTLVPRFDRVKSRLFQSRPDLYCFTCQCLYNPSTLKFIDLRGLIADNDTKKAICDIMGE
jgi:hypothetical protein